MDIGRKIVVIGGGSSYTPEIVEGLLERYDRLPVRELWLVDIEEGRRKMEIVGELARRMIARAGRAIKLQLTLDRRRALEGADYVVTQMRVGQLEARRWDEMIPPSFGVIGQETTGPGGMMKALRTIPVLLGICRDMEELAPRAWLLNFTNPAGMVTEAALRHSAIRTVGLCNAPIGFRKGIGELYDVSADDVDPEFAGINHLHWVTALRVRGEDKLAELLDSDSHFARWSAIVPGLPWDHRFLRKLGAIPSYYLRYFYMRDEMLAEQLAAVEEGTTRAERVMEAERELFELYRDPQLDIKPPQLALRGGAYYSEAAVNLMVSLHGDVRDVQTLNVRNGGSIGFLEPDAVIEVNCEVTADGPRPIAPKTVPRPIRGLLHAVKTYETLAVEAAVHGDRELAVQAMACHPLVPSVAVARKLFDAMLERNRAYLAQFVG